MEEYIMIGFSIMMWFSSALLIFFSISLLKGNYSSVHGKVFETTNDKNGYAKALGKPVLLIGICVLLSGVIAVVLPKDYAISIAVVFILFIVSVSIAKAVALVESNNKEASKTLNIFFIISLLSLNYLKTSCFVFPKYAHSNISCINYAPILLILSRSLHSGQEK